MKAFGTNDPQGMTPKLTLIVKPTSKLVNLLVSTSHEEWHRNLRACFPKTIVTLEIFLVREFLIKHNSQGMALKSILTIHDPLGMALNQ